VFARIAHYYTADPSPYWELEQGQRFRGRAREVLRQMDGYEGSYFFMDRKSGKAISITLWESEEAMNRSEEVARTIARRLPSS
jgi:heme-degrading monooxygenase HmoA